MLGRENTYKTERIAVWENGPLESRGDFMEDIVLEESILFIRVTGCRL